MLSGHKNHVRSVVFTYNSKYIVSGGDDCCIRVWNLEDKNEETVLQCHTDCVNSVAITYDNKIRSFWRR